MAGSARQRFSCKSLTYAGAVVQSHPSTSNLTEEQHLAHKESKQQQQQQNITLNTISWCYLSLSRALFFIIDIVPIPAAAYGEHCDTHNFTSSVTTKTSPRVSNNQRREKHNLKERERRWVVILPDIATDLKIR